MRRGISPATTVEEPELRWGRQMCPVTGKWRGHSFTCGAAGAAITLTLADSRQGGGAATGPIARV